MNEHLDNTNVYEVMEDTPSKIVNDINQKIRSWADEWEYEEQISPEICKWIVNRNAKPGYFLSNLQSS